MPRCIIFSAGTHYGMSFAPQPDDYIICADAGYIACRSENLSPDLIVGDFDSMSEPQENCSVLRFPVEKDDTDTMIAVKKGLERGCTEFHILGATGGTRLDHTFANIQSLAYIATHNCRGFIYDKNFTYTVIHNDTFVIDKKIDWGIISVFCMGDKAEGVTITGVQYPISDSVIDMTFPLGVSNHIIEAKATVSVRNGYLLVCVQRE